ncbi:MAG: SUMF1/EgtB/PvdO family nonheme iron enzyme [Solirubrobacterales bacterium]|nr:SUMF1/EgtB/PvdO family nonheme iron enzyme [Solirubrobacterales bacterium]MBV9681875.1 SUMF1/EgtB/PvdO family nonheme iron enzyme [Solirubrobacterales bacterium]
MLAPTVSSSPDRTRGVPALAACVPVAGVYRLGDACERIVTLDPVLIGRWPVTTAHVRAFVRATGRTVSPSLRRRLESEQLADHPATEVSFDDVLAFCAWAGAELERTVRLPRGDEWEAAARGAEARTWPWGDVFDPERCNSSESGWGWTVPVRAHPDGAAASGAEQMAGNVWEWVGDPPDEDGWRSVRGGSYLDTAWGVRACRVLPADPQRATATTGFRLAIECDKPTRPGGASTR